MDLSQYGLGNLGSIGGLGGGSGGAPQTSSASASNSFGSPSGIDSGLLIGVGAILVVLIFGVFLLRD